MNALMSNFDFDSADIHRSSKWGVQIDQAILENRLMEA
jgi:hypothetical protein